jgi:senataxin
MDYLLKLALPSLRPMRNRQICCEIKLALPSLCPSYAQQANFLRNCFAEKLGPDYERHIEVNTVDGYQGREENIFIFSCVRAAGSHGVGFLSDVRRMNVALTRAKFFLLSLHDASPLL